MNIWYTYWDDEVGGNRSTGPEKTHNGRRVRTHAHVKHSGAQSAATWRPVREVIVIMIQ